MTWAEEVLHEAKVLITGRLSAERADIRPSEAYDLIGRLLIEEGKSLARSVESRRNQMHN